MVEAETLYPVPGIRLGVVCAGIKYPGRRDLVVLEIAAGSACAAVFTRNAFCAAPVVVAKRHLDGAAPHYLVINTGNANAGTGQRGVEDAVTTCAVMAELTGCRTAEVLPFSTGVIGEPLPLERLLASLPQALADLRPAGWLDAAHGIMTTDTRAKAVSRRVILAGQSVTVTGIAKGAGMIRPDMATMLAFLATDAGVDNTLLRACLLDAVEESFNAITVDGDTSTNDACILLATGQSGVRIDREDSAYAALKEVIRAVCVALAQAIIRDGEGATKLIEVTVNGAASVADARLAARTIVSSPLVKTAFFASDPNWGRILAAVGRSGLDALQVEAIVLYLDEVCIVERGGRAARYTEEQGQAVMRRPDITIRVQLGRGTASTRIWTTDLSFDYVKINAEYRT